MATTSTTQKTLRESVSLWSTTKGIAVPHHATPRKKEYDVVIIGSGISGALMAEAVSGKGKSVLMVDRRDPIKGSTIASTAMIQHEIDVPLHKLASMIGEDKANRAWKRSEQSVFALQKLIARDSIHCDFQMKKTLFLSGDSMGSRAMNSEVEARRAAGLGAEYLKASDVRQEFGLDRTAAITSKVSASANPGQMTAGIIRKLLADNLLELCAPAEARDVLGFSGGACISIGEAGVIIKAGSVIFCSGYEFLEPLKAQEHDVVSTWAMASRPGLKVPDWLDDYLVWEANDPYLYFRTDVDGRVIVGGEDEDSATSFQSDKKRAQKSKIIAAKLEELTGIKFGKPDYVWSAAFGVTSTGLPLMGAVPNFPNVYAVMGFGGNGITFSKIASEIISSIIDGRSDPDEDLFRFS